MMWNIQLHEIHDTVEDKSNHCQTYREEKGNVKKIPMVDLSRS